MKAFWVTLVLVNVLVYAIYPNPYSLLTGILAMAMVYTYFEGEGE